MVLLGCSRRTPVGVPPPVATPDDVCRQQGYDFAFLDETGGLKWCGRGPGTLCGLSLTHRCDGRSYLRCEHGRMSATDCRGECSYRMPAVALQSPPFYGYCVEQHGW